MKNELLKLTPAEFCKATKACSDGADYAKTQPDMVAVWDNCPRIDWMVWILNAIDAPKYDKGLRLFAVWAARNTPMANGKLTGSLITDPRSVAALDVAERFANGGATQGELEAAGEAAGEAAWAAAREAARAAQCRQFRLMIKNPFILE